MSENGDAQNATGSWPQQRLDRMRFSRQAGLQYDGKRDVYKVAGYVPEGGLDISHYLSRYERQHVAGRVVDMPAMTTWRNPPEVLEPESNPDNLTEFEARFEELRKEHRLWHRLERTDRLAGIGRYGVLLIGQRGDADLSAPMERMSGPGDVLYMSSFHEGHARIDTWEKNIQSPRFGLPDTYKVDLSSGVTGFPEGEERVHWSRVIHVAEDLMADEVFGRPRLKRVMNLLMDLEKITASTGEAYWQLADKVLQLKIDPKVETNDTLLDKLGEALEEMQHDLRRQITVQGGELSQLGGDTPDPSDPADLLMMLIASASGIPKRILFGTETGQRASDQDERQWLGAVSERQERFAEPMILRALTDRLIEFGALPKPSAGEYDVLWPNLFEASDEQKAEANLNRARTAKELTPMGGDPMELGRIDEEGDFFLVERTPDGRTTPSDIEPPEPDLETGSVE